MTEQVWKCAAGCGRTTNQPPYPEHLNWPFLCGDCANEPPRKAGRVSSWPIVVQDSFADAENADDAFRSLVGDAAEMA